MGRQERRSSHGQNIPCVGLGKYHPVEQLEQKRSFGMRYPFYVLYGVFDKVAGNAVLLRTACIVRDVFAAAGLFLAE